MGRPARGVRRRGGRPDLRVRARVPRQHPVPQRPDAARHRADDRADRGQHLPGRAVARAALLQPAGPRLRAVPDPGPRPLAVRVGDPSGRRDHGRQRPDRGARGPAGARPEGGLAMAATSGATALRRDRHRWRPQRAGRRGVPRPGRAADGRPGAARDVLGGAAATRELAPGRTRPDARPHRRAAAAVGRPRPRAQAPRAVARRPGGPRLRARARTATRSTLWGDVGADGRRTPGPVRGRRRCATRRSTGWSARWPASSASSPARTPPDIALAGSRRRAGRAPVSGGRSAASGATTAGRSPGSCRWPSRISWPSRSRPTRSRRPSPGAASSTRRWGRGRRGRPRSCSSTRPGNDGGAAGQTVFARGGPGALSDALAAARERPASRSGPVPRSPRSPRAGGRATGVVLDVGRGAHAHGPSSPASTRSGP